jgi:thioesterase domain-containing protein
VFGLQEPGDLCDREPSVEDRAAAYLDEIVAACPAGAVHLAGHSFGGLVAFEIARQLSATGRTPGVVALIDTTAPAIDGERVEDDLVRQLSAILEAAALDDDLPADPDDERRTWIALAQFADRALGDGASAAHHAPPRLGGIERFCRRFHFLPSGEGMGYVELRRFLRAMRAAFRSARRYAPPACSGRVTLFQAGSAPTDTPHEAVTWKRLQIERWSALALGGLDVREVPGRHLDLLGPPHADVLAARLAATLDTARPAAEP